MDVQPLAISIGLPGQRKTRAIQRSESRAAPADGGGGGAATIASRRTWLVAYTAISIVAGLTALAWATLRIPISPTIDPDMNGSAIAGPSGGMLLWIAFGMIGSLRVLPAPGGHGVWTFHFPFVAAAMVLGGPTAGAWVAFVSTIERRELDSVPWYGALANHAVMALAAVIGGLTVEGLQGSLQITTLTPGVANLIAIVGGTLVLVALLTVTTAVTIVLREGQAAGNPFDVMIGQVGRITVAEIALAWLFTVAYTAVGWWAPIVIALITLALWPVDVEGPDPLTGLVRAARFDAFLNGAVSRTRRGVGRGGVLVSIDLDRFGPINKNPELGFAIGNEVLAEMGRRLRTQTRAGDAVARPGGDEFWLYFAGAFDPESAIRIGQRLLDAIERPVATTAAVVDVSASIGLVIVELRRDLPDGATLKHRADITMQTQKAAGGGVRLYEPGVDPD